MQSDKERGFERVYELIKHRWVLEIIRAISKGHTRYGEILALHPFLSKTELNRKLAMLQAYEVIEKDGSERTAPYRLLSFGEDLEKLHVQMEALGRKFV